MIAHFGQLWITKYGEEDQGIWRMFLAEFTLRKLNDGIDLWRSCSSDFAEFPPTPKQFVALCEGRLREEDRRTKTPLWLGVDMTRHESDRLKHIHTEEENAHKRLVANHYLKKAFAELGKPHLHRDITQKRDKN